MAIIKVWPVTSTELYISRVTIYVLVQIDFPILTFVVMYIYMYVKYLYKTFI